MKAITIKQMTESGDQHNS